MHADDRGHVITAFFRAGGHGTGPPQLAAARREMTDDEPLPPGSARRPGTRPSPEPRSAVMSSRQNPRQPEAVPAWPAPGRRADPGHRADPRQGAGPAAAAARLRPDRARYAWLYEDDDIWGADTAGSTPPRSHGDDWHAPRL
jgi:hypothetical protein